MFELFWEANYLNLRILAWDNYCFLIYAKPCHEKGLTSFYKEVSYM